MANGWCQDLNRIHASGPLLDQCAPLSQRHGPDIRRSCLLSKVQKNAQKQKHPLLTFWCVPFQFFSCALSLQIISCLIIKLHEEHLNGFIIFDYVGITQFTEPYSNC